jgi:RNA polymerase sigma factor (sigma-70 family)
MTIKTPEQEKELKRMQRINFFKKNYQFKKEEEYWEQFLNESQVPIHANESLIKAQPGSLNQRIGMDESDLQRYADRTFLKEHVKKCMKYITPRERKALKMKFGLLGEKSHTYEEIAKEFWVSRARVREIVIKALQKLRDYPLFYSYFKLLKVGDGSYSIF